MVSRLETAGKRVDLMSEAELYQMRDDLRSCGIVDIESHWIKIQLVFNEVVVVLVRLSCRSPTHEMARLP